MRVCQAEYPVNLLTRVFDCGTKKQLLEYLESRGSSLERASEGLEYVLSKKKFDEFQDIINGVYRANKPLRVAQQDFSITFQGLSRRIGHLLNLLKQAKYRGYLCFGLEFETMSYNNLGIDSPEAKIEPWFFPKRVYTALCKYNIDTISDLFLYYNAEDTFTSIRGLGVDGTSEIVNFLERLDFAAS